jgi:hypothetical protein
MRALKAFFISRLLREKLLLVLFVALGAVMWATNFSSRAGRAWRAHRTVANELTEQKQWLANRVAIENAAVEAVKNLDPAKTLDDTQLVGDLSSLAREHNLRFTNDTPQTERSGQFAVHTVQFTISRADWEPLRKFYLAIASRSPYIGIEQISMATDRANPSLGLLNASFRVSSVETIR